MGVSILRLLYYIREELLIVAATTSRKPCCRAWCRSCKTWAARIGRRSGDPDRLFLQPRRDLPLSRDRRGFLAQRPTRPLRLEQQAHLVAVRFSRPKARRACGPAFVRVWQDHRSSAPFPSPALPWCSEFTVLAEALTFVNVVGNCDCHNPCRKWDRALA
jgi:hypothetical protein